jgi:hypothetical protein
LEPAKGLSTIDDIFSSLFYRLNAAESLASEEKDELVNLFDDFSLADGESSPLSSKVNSESKRKDTVAPATSSTSSSSSSSSALLVVDRKPPARSPIYNFPPCFGTSLGMVGVPTLPWESTLHYKASMKKSSTSSSSSSSSSSMTSMTTTTTISSSLFDDVFVYERNMMKKHDDGRRNITQMIQAHSQQRARSVALALASQFESEAMPITFNPKVYLKYLSHVEEFMLSTVFLRACFFQNVNISLFHFIFIHNLIL